LAEVIKLKPKETYYDGYRFRSRLEARWAVFFNALGVPYDYEFEGFDLRERGYLPDFWLPQQECWVEIKPRRRGWFYSVKSARLSDHTGQKVLYIQGNPWPGEYGIQLHRPEPAGFCSEPHVFAHGRYRDERDKLWVVCREWHASCLNAITPATEFWYPVTEAEAPRVMAAYKAARSAHFEHGESPRY